MRKLVFILFLCLVFSACASTDVEPATRDLSPTVAIQIKPDNSAFYIYASYSGDDWAFMYGVELVNEAGEVKRSNFTDPRRRVLSGGRVSEFGFISFAFVEPWFEWYNGGEIMGRALCSDMLTELKPVKVIIKD